MPATAIDAIDGLTTSVAVKAPCITFSDTDITLAGLQTFQGITLVEGDRHLCVGQANPIDNGIYRASTGTWVRAADFDGNRDAVRGTLVPVNANEGAALFELTSSNPVRIGTSALTFVLRYGANVRYDVTAAELTAGAFVVNALRPPGHLYRYGTNTFPGVTDMASAFHAALAQAYAGGSEVVLPAGVIGLSFVTITSAVRIRTEGFATVLQQLTGNVGTRMINIAASNVSFALEGVTVKGNIATDTGEQNHSIFVRAAGSIANITIGDVYGENIRGDVLYLGALTGQTTRNIKFGRITGKNILRNVVSIAGACQVRGDAAIVDTSCGYTVLDIEPDNVASTDIYIGMVKGAVLQCAPPTAAVAATRIHFGTVDLDPAHAADSTPAYAFRDVAHAVNLRNTVGLTIDNLKIRDHTGLGLRYIWNSGEQEGKAIKIGYLDCSGVGSGESTINAVINADRIQSLTIDDADVALQAVGDYVIFGSSSRTRVRIGSMRVNGTVIRFCLSSRFERIVINSTNAVNAFRDMIDSIVSNSDITLPRLGSNLSRVTFENVNATCSTAYISGTSDNCRKINTRFGGVSASGTFTMGAAATTTVNNANVSADSQVQLMPTNAAAALLMANPGVYVSPRNEGVSFVVAVQSGSAAGTETFAYTIL